MPTVEELIAACNRLQDACVDVRNSVVQFVTAPDNNHPEGDAWLGIIETNLAAAYANVGAVVEGLKDCYFDRALQHAKLAASLVMGCRYIAAHCVQVRYGRMPDEYNNFFRVANDTLSELNGYFQLLPIQIKEKMPS